MANWEPGVSEGLNLNNLNETSQAEIDANLTRVWSWRGPLYEMFATALMLDYAPDFAKLQRWGSDFFGRPNRTNVVQMSCQNIHSYIYLGWETGIQNEFETLQRNGMSKAGLMELVMFTQLHAGMRGLGHTYRAIGDFLPVWAEPKTEALYPEGWAPDPDAFKSGLDFATRECTAADRKAITEWYEKTIGYVPESILFGLKHHPEFIKVNRAKWEVAIKTLPKQVAPLLMLRHNMITANRDGLKEAGRLAKAWGVANSTIIQSLAVTTMFFTGFEGLYAAHDALDDILSE